MGLWIKSPEESYYTSMIQYVSVHCGLPSLLIWYCAYAGKSSISWYLYPKTAICSIYISHGFSGIARVFSLNVPRFEFWLFKEACGDPLVMSSKTALWCRIRKKQWDFRGLSFLYRRGVGRASCFFLETPAQTVWSRWDLALVLVSASCLVLIEITAESVHVL